MDLKKKRKKKQNLSTQTTAGPPHPLPPFLFSPEAQISSPGPSPHFRPNGPPAPASSPLPLSHPLPVGPACRGHPQPCAACPFSPSCAGRRPPAPRRRLPAPPAPPPSKAPLQEHLKLGLHPLHQSPTVSPLLNALKPPAPMAIDGHYFRPKPPLPSSPYKSTPRGSELPLRPLPCSHTLLLALPHRRRPSMKPGRRHCFDLRHRRFSMALLCDRSIIAR
jgi:hypothetical protein